MHRNRLLAASMLSLCSIALLAPVTGAGAQDGMQRGVDVLDVEITNASTPLFRGREGAYPNGQIGIGFLTTSHNVGTVNVDWIPAGFPGQTLDNRHPFIGQNLFRLRDGRLEQIGLAWMKHGFYSTNEGCADPDGEFLGVGCFDTYGSFTNTNRQYLGPRSEIDPFTGYWEPCGSHFDTGEVGYPPEVPGDCVMTHYSDFIGHDNDDHRLRVTDQNILDTGALNRFFIEGFYIVAGDENIENNWGHTRYNAIPPGAEPEWTFQQLTLMTQTPAIDMWGDVLTTAQPESEGKVRVAARVVPIDATHNRFEYNLYNMNLDRQIESFEVPLGPGVVPTDFGFWAPIEEEEPQFSMDPWTPTVTAGAITWTAPAPDMGAGEQFPNTIRFGTMYTFWFTAESGAGDSIVALGPFKNGAATTLEATVPGPCVLNGDINGDGNVDTADLGLLIAQFGTPGPGADLNGDLIVDTADLGLLIASFGEDCIAG